MPRRKFIDKKSAQTFSLVYRAQSDPLIHDSDASDMVFREAAVPKRKTKQRGDLEEEFGLAIRDNEGEAANHGIYYDDTEYDYMQHMREIGQGNEGYYIEAPSKKKGKEKVRLEDALREVSLDDKSVASGMSTQSAASELLGEEMLPSDFVRPTNYQDQQDVPDAIGGFQPDMDPRLREVLEALEDEAYVDDDDNIFNELAEDGHEVDQYEWEESAGWEDEEVEGDGWESDDTITPGKEHEKSINTPIPCDSNKAPLDELASGTGDHGDGDWMAEFTKFKKDVKAQRPTQPAHAPSDHQSSVVTGSSALTSGRRKKRKGALTSTSGYSMSSSVLARTETQTLLDARFDKIEEEYADGDGFDDDLDDNASMTSGMTGMTGMTGLSRMSGLSKASGMSRMSGMSSASEKPPQLVLAGLDSVMDEFLGGYSTTGKRNRVKRGAPQTGLEQLDEIRQGLGPARVKLQRV